MKKYFMFVAVAAAGMLASCSSESLTAGSDPKIEPTQEERVPIQLSVSSPSINLSKGETRGTGTVGGVGSGTNVWAGQRINVFMFDKGTLDLTVENATGPVYFYDDAQMITPGTTENKIPGEAAATNSGEAMLANGDIKYYPATGNFDFFGYHGDDAITGALDDSDNDLWTVPFTINGSQDLMSTKAEPTTAEISTLGTTRAADFYSAYAARKGVHPTLKFNHLLTRLAFVIKAGDENAAGWDGSAQVAADAVKVNSIEVYSKTKGKMAVAWTSAPTNMITWDAATTTPAVVAEGAPAWLALKERPVMYSQNSDPTNPALFITKAAYDILPASGGAGDNDDKADYTLTDAANSSLVALTPTIPKVHNDGADNMVKDETPIGESLIVAPGASATETYQMRVNVSQTVKTNWNTGATADKNQTYELEIPAPTGGFLANTSYKVVLTVYGFERIQVMTEIIPWDENTTPIEVGQD